MAIEIIAGTPPAGGQDRAARALAAALSVEATVTNIPGRGGGNGWDHLATRVGDAGVVSISSPTIITNKLLGESDIDDRDLTPLGHLCTEFLAFVGRRPGPVSKPNDVLDALAAGETFSLATARGNINHMAIGIIARHLGVNPGAVPVRVFDSGRHVAADVVAGQSAVGVVSAASVIPEVEAGKLRVLAMSAPSRMTGSFAGVPTWKERGVDCVIGTWRGVVGPSGLTADQVEHWDWLLGMAVRSEVWRRELTRHHWVDTYLPSAETRAFLDEQRVLLADAIAGLADG